MTKQSKITKSANGKTCINCGGYNAYACHYNGTYQHQYGKGRGIKAHDMASAELCHQCDQIFTEGSTKGFIDKIDRDCQFLHLIMLTNIRRFDSGVLKS